MVYSAKHPVASRERILGFIAENLSQKEAAEKYGIDKGYLSYQCNKLGLKMKKHVRPKQVYKKVNKHTGNDTGLIKGAWV